MTEPYPPKEKHLPDQAQLQASNDVSLHELFGACRTNFMELYLAIASEQSESILLASLGDEHGRLRVWGRNSGADRTGRGSLDDRLRNNVRIRDMVAQMLESLYSCLVKGKWPVSVILSAKRWFRMRARHQEQNTYST
jgi:hypothetical protein